MWKLPRSGPPAAARPLPRTRTLIAAAFAVAPLCIPLSTNAFNITAGIERGGNGTSGPNDHACTFCENKSTRVSTSFSTGFPAPPVPVATPANSEIGGKAFADLATGVMRGQSHAASYGHNEQHQIRFVSRMEETIEIDVPPGLPTDERFVTLIGEVHGTANATNRAFGNLNYSLQAFNLTAGASLDDKLGWTSVGQGNPAIVVTTLGNGYRFRLKVTIPNSGKLTIASQLDGTAWAEARLTTGVGIADVLAGNTATLSMTLPEGATYTSTSGVFLTVPPSPEIDIEVSGANADITYSGVLESSPSLASGSWAPVVGATSPYQFPVPASGSLFYRAVAP